MPNSKHTKCNGVQLLSPKPRDKKELVLGRHYISDCAPFEEKKGKKMESVSQNVGGFLDFEFWILYASQQYVKIFQIWIIPSYLKLTQFVWISHEKSYNFQAQNHLWFRIKQKREYLRGHKMPPEVCLSFFHCTTIQVNTWVKHDKIQKFIDPAVTE